MSHYQISIVAPCAQRLTWALLLVALLDHLPEADVAARAAVEAALLVALLLDAPTAPVPLAAAAAPAAARPLTPP